MSKNLSWDLTDLYQGLDDPQLTADQDKLPRLISRLTKEYKGNLTASSVKAEFFEAYETVWSLMSRLETYAALRFATEKNKPGVKEFFQSTSELLSQSESELAWVDVELLSLSDAEWSRIQSKKSLQNYHHYLSRLAKRRDHMLSEQAEVVMSQKSQTSDQAFSRLYEQFLSQSTFIYTYKRKRRSLSLSEIVKLVNYDPKRSVRKRAAKVYSSKLASIQELYTFTLNNLLLDRAVGRKLRHYKSPEQESFDINQTSAETVGDLLTAVDKSKDMVAEYYQAKRRLLQVDDLHEWDRYAPLPKANSERIAWSQAKQICLDAYTELSPTMGQIVQEFFDKRWIDVKPQQGKSHGAFCTESDPGSHPYIMLNYTGNWRDVMTLAHELGHGIHFYLAGQHQTMLNLDPGLAVAEVASVFGEQIVFDKLMAEAKSKTEKRSMLAGKIEDDIATVFRQVAFHKFELALNVRRAEGEMSAEEICERWQTNVQWMFGQGLQLTQDHKWWWIPVLHFFHYDFYVYSYAYGQLVSYAVADALKSGKASVDDYLELLSMGGSASPEKLLAQVNVDLSDKKIWERSLKVIEEQVTEFTSLLTG